MKRSFFRFMNVICPRWMEHGGNVLPKRGLNLFLNGKNPGGSDIGSSAKGLAFLWFQDPTLPTSSLKKRRDVGNVFVTVLYIISRAHTIYIYNLSEMRVPLNLMVCHIFVIIPIKNLP